ncbi:uncharacterized protein [Diadema antillarum]|uniref:uncharacterized protein n=1 Tax=Diadema antillarum TaxID=105358 RepID=UPI003A86826B
MGNWPSVNSESSTASSLSNMEEAQEEGCLEEDTDEDDEGEEMVDCGASEKSFFSEEEILPREDSEKDRGPESSQDDTSDEDDLYECARQGSGFGLRIDYQHLRDDSDDEDDDHSDDDDDDEDDEEKEMEEDNDGNVGETSGFDEVVSKTKEQDSFCSLPVPPPPSPHSPSLVESVMGNMPG